MISRGEGEKIALDVHAARPDWPVTSILAALGRARDRGDAFSIRRAALVAARNPANGHPGTIADDGPHWTPPETPTRRKCPAHELEHPCRSCRADNLANGTEQPTVQRRHYAEEHPGTPMPPWFRQQLETR